MKKIITVLLVVLLAFSFVSCKGECELCGQTASLKKMTIEGEDQKLCEECYAKIGECESCSKTLPLREYKGVFGIIYKVCQQCYDDLKDLTNPIKSNDLYFPDFF